MPTYTTQNPAAQSTDPWAEAAKNFLKSPTYAKGYMDDAQSRLAPEQSPRPYPRAGSIDAYSLNDRDLLAGVLTGEGGSLEDMGYISNVIGNRVNSGSYPNALREVLLQDGQFSALNGVTGYAGGEQGTDHWRRPSPTAYEVADAYLRGGRPDMTGGALNYYTTSGGQFETPSWSNDSFRNLPGSTHRFGRS